MEYTFVMFALIAYFTIGIILIDLMDSECEYVVLFAIFWIIVIPIKTVVKIFEMITSKHTQYYDNEYKGWH